MLYTMTTNPAVDVNVTTDYVSTGVVNRTRDMVFTANGKGLNVSFALQRFGVSSGIIGFFGGFTGDYITSYCKKQGYPLVEEKIEGTTRINFFICAEQGEFKFVNKGPLVSQEAQDHLLQQIEQLTDLDLLTIHGSAANGQAEDFYDRVFEICQKKGIPVALDISSLAFPPLR